MGKSSKLYRDYYGNIREGQTYRISGDWNLLGGGSDGAGGRTRTYVINHQEVKFFEHPPGKSAIC